MQARTFILMALAATASTAALADGSNLVVNGSFEDPAFSSRGVNQYASITGWTSTNGIEIRRNWVGTAQDGLNFAELDTDGTGNSSMMQSITTEIGATYRFSFYYSNRPFKADGNTANVPASSSGLSWLLGDASGTAPAQATITDDTNHWTLVTYDYVATSTTTLLQLNALGTVDGLGSSIDNVSLVQIASPVPEPSSLALLVAGLCGTAVLRQKKARASRALTTTGK